jgi:hypothetical protein
MPLVSGEPERLVGLSTPVLSPHLGGAVGADAVLAGGTPFTDDTLHGIPLIQF